MERANRFGSYLFIIVTLASTLQQRGQADDKQATEFNVGVILDLSTLVGKMSRTSVSMGIEDFYDVHRNFSTRVVLHTRDAGDVVQAADKVLDLLENKQARAIIGPQKSSQAVFLARLVDKAQVPLISFSATSPSLSSISTHYFIRTLIDDSYQVKPLSSIIAAFGWKEVILVYEDTEYGRGILPYLVDAFQETETKIVYRSVVSPSLKDDPITGELYKLMTMEAKVFIVHVTPATAARFFPLVKKVGMMSQGYAWIITSGLSNVADSLDPSVMESMQGSLGMKLYVPRSEKINDFFIRWRRRFRKENPLDEPAEPSIFELWAYDTAWAVAYAAEKVGVADSYHLKALNNHTPTILQNIEVSEDGPKLLEAILNCRFRGLRGDFYFVERQLQSFYSIFQIINIGGRGGRHVGFWTQKYGIVKSLEMNGTGTYSTLITDLNPIIWPGETNVVPKGWQNPITGRKLKIGVPIKDDFKEFVKVERDPTTNALTVSGFSIDVFEAVLKTLPYAVSYEYIPFEDAQGHSAGSYDDLVQQVYRQKYDAVVGDVVIIANRSTYADFTLPYTETGVAMIVAVKESINTDAWIFLKPLSTDLWSASFAFFVCTGIVVWVMEHRINEDFRGPFTQQLGTMLYFIFSTLVFAHREKVKSFLSKLVVIIWLFTVLILTSSYTASLSSMLTVKQLKPTVTDVNQLKSNGDYVGYQKGNFEEGLLRQQNFNELKMKAYNNTDEYAEALNRGSQNGGVAAIFHAIPHIKLFLAKHCKGYTMVGPVYKAGGLGFVFPKGSPLVHDISRGILNVTEGEIMLEIEKKWFGDQVCLNEGSTVSSDNSDNLSFRSFWGLFLITGTASTCVLFIFLGEFLYKNWHQLRNIESDKSIKQRIIAWFEYYNQKDTNAYSFKRDNVIGKDSHLSLKSRIKASASNESLCISNFSDANSSLQEEKMTCFEPISHCAQDPEVCIDVTT